MIIIRVQNLKSNIFKDINIEKYTFEDFEKTIAFTIFVFITAENVFANNQKNNFKGNKLKGN